MGPPRAGGVVPRGAAVLAACWFGSSGGSFGRCGLWGFLLCPVLFSPLLRLVFVLWFRLVRVVVLLVRRWLLLFVLCWVLFVALCVCLLASGLWALRLRSLCSVSFLLVRFVRCLVCCGCLLLRACLLFLLLLRLLRPCVWLARLLFLLRLRLLLFLLLRLLFVGCLRLCLVRRGGLGVLRLCALGCCFGSACRWAWSRLLCRLRPLRRVVVVCLAASCGLLAVVWLLVVVVVFVLRFGAFPGCGVRLLWLLRLLGLRVVVLSVLVSCLSLVVPSLRSVRGCGLALPGCSLVGFGLRCALGLLGGACVCRWCRGLLCLRRLVGSCLWVLRLVWFARCVCLLGLAGLLVVLLVVVRLVRFVVVCLGSVLLVLRLLRLLGSRWCLCRLRLPLLRGGLPGFPLVFLLFLGFRLLRVPALCCCSRLLASVLRLLGGLALCRCAWPRSLGRFGRRCCGRLGWSCVRLLCVRCSVVGARCVPSGLCSSVRRWRLWGSRCLAGSLALLRLVRLLLVSCVRACRVRCGCLLWCRRLFLWVPGGLRPLRCRLRCLRCLVASVGCVLVVLARLLALLPAVLLLRLRLFGSFWLSSLPVGGEAGGLPLFYARMKTRRLSLISPEQRQRQRQRQNPVSSGVGGFLMRRLCGSYGGLPLHSRACGGP